MTTTYKLPARTLSVGENETTIGWLFPATFTVTVLEADEKFVVADAVIFTWQEPYAVAVKVGVEDPTEHPAVPASAIE